MSSKPRKHAHVLMLAFILTLRFGGFYGCFESRLEVRPDLIPNALGHYWLHGRRKVACVRLVT